MWQKLGVGSTRLIAMAGAAVITVPARAQPAAASARCHRTRRVLLSVGKHFSMPLLQPALVSRRIGIRY
jgi:hypothetical protein